MKFIGLTKRLIATVLLTSTVVTTVLSAVQLAFEYRAEKRAVDTTLKGFETTGVASMRNLLWVMDDHELQHQAEAALGIREIVLVRVLDESGRVVVEKSKGNFRASGYEPRRYVLKADDGREFGTLEIGVSLAELMGLMQLRLASILLTNFVKTIIVAFALSLMIRRSLVNPVIGIAQHFRKQGTSDADRVMLLAPIHKHGFRDELDELVDGINESENRTAELYCAHQRLIANQQRAIEDARHHLMLSQQQLRDEQVKAMQASRMAELGTLAGGVAHEINNPLAIVFGYVEMLQLVHDSKGPKSVDFGAYVKKIQNNLVRIKGIVHGLKTYARDGAGDPLAPTFVNQMVRETVELCKEMTYKRKLTLHMVLLDDDKEVNCRPPQIMQVLVNLINNAADAIEGQAEPWIRVAVHFEDGNVVIRVTDSGPGIPSLVAERLFTPFYTTKSVGKGTGLGLSISRGIIDQHQGQLKLNREADHTEFEISLPTAA